MDPTYQVEEHGTDWTFSRTLVGVEELRKAHADDNDWPLWKMKVVDTVRSGAKLEGGFISLKQKVLDCAKQSDVYSLSVRLNALEKLNDERKQWGRIVADKVWVIVAVLVAWGLGRWK